MNNIQNINGEYLKFYFSKNTSMPKILQNTGSVIILNKTGDSYSYNELWVADEFIATGYGFGKFNIKQVLDKYGDSYTDELGNEYSSYIDYKFDEAHNAYVTSINYTDELKDHIYTYFVNNLGDSSNTYIIYDNNELKLSYLPYLSQAAEYEDAQVESTHIEIYGYEYSSRNYDLGNVLISDFYENSAVFYLPIGSKISRIKLDANVKLNDVSPNEYKLNISYISNSYLGDESGFAGDNFIDYNYTDIYGYQDSNINVESDYHNVTVDLGSNTNDSINIFVKEGLNKLISSSIDYQGTLEYSYYPLLAENCNTFIYSTENAIKPNNYSLGNIYINGCYEITYISQNRGTLSLKDLHPKLDSTESMNHSHKMIINNKVHIDVNQGYTYFGIPKNFSIIDAKWVHLSNLSQNHKESYMNWTGDIFKDASNSYDNMRCHITYYNTDSSEIRYIKYDHYVTYIPESTTLYLEFRNEDSNNIIFAKESEDVEEILTYDFCTTPNFVQNEIYNGTHWFTPIDLTYMYIR